MHSPTEESLDSSTENNSAQSDSKTLEEHFEDQAVDREFINMVARRFLKDVLDQCDKKGISKEGLVREIRAGVKDHYFEEITEDDNQE
ncbi:MAG: hypothetical protein ABEJ36_03240 [Candidatus Nanosalina sp.]